MDENTELFVALCLAVVRQAQEVTETAWRSMREAQRIAEYKFGVFPVGDYDHEDVAWYAALGIAANEGAYIKYGVAEALPERAEAIRLLSESHPDVVAAAQKAVKDAVGGAA